VENGVKNVVKAVRRSKFYSQEKPSLLCENESKQRRGDIPLSQRRPRIID
jgi:hypothetical protein